MLKIQRSLQKSENTLLQECPVLRTSWPMTIRWEQNQFICLLVFNQCVDQDSRLPEQYILVQQTMAQPIGKR